jgi:hypothetical protein
MFMDVHRYSLLVDKDGVMTKTKKLSRCAVLAMPRKLHQKTIEKGEQKPI